MAGYNTRFHNAGFDIPKYLLPWKNSTVISTIIEELGDFQQLILVANKRDKFFADQVYQIVSAVAKCEFEVLYIDDTKGQAETAAIGISKIKNKDLPVFIHNSDTIVSKRNLRDIVTAFENKSSAYIDVFVGSSPAYSYVSLEGQNVTNIAEKQHISPFASSGLYGFKSSELFMSYFNITEANYCLDASKEIYVSTVLQHIISDNLLVTSNSYSNDHETIVLGSPQEYGLEITKQILSQHS